ncbi:DUF1673 family protein [uncultured Methanoregula sp.]|uniref:DUF1673 family protein n=1 Tax=uncultured Methanoregula sp. TaxID=1005933 RepID=UPI002AAC03E1|nr:DUF1673 family protein [uncultured Methanoregula sp.]
MTLTRISEIVRRRLGWCPNKQALKAQRIAPSPLPAGSPAIPAGPGTAPSTPGSQLYQHTQLGTIQIWATLASVGIIILSILFIGGIWITYLVAAILLIALVLFGSLTVMVRKDDVHIRFGPFGIVRKTVPLGYITSVSTVKNPWYYGWGIRWTPDGPLYNVSGVGGVMLVLADGKKIRIGSDEPEALNAAITRAIH